MTALEMKTDGEPPLYEAWHALLRRGGLIPFLGAGASMENREHGESWGDDTRERFGPSGGELAARLARIAAFPLGEATSDLARVAQYAELRLGRSIVEDELRHVFSPSPPSSGLHHYLASFDAPLLILTTNYDSMLEDAFVNLGRPYHLVVQKLGTDRKFPAWVKPAGAIEGHEVRDVQLDLSAATTIYKLHGSATPQTAEDYVIAEDDYLQFMQRMMLNRAIPRLFSEPMRTKPFLFIGYSLSDWNLRLLLFQLKDFVDKRRLGDDLRSWAVMRHVNDVDKRLWNERRVQLFEVELRDFVAAMSAQRSGGT